ncbi:MAG: AAA family ATPase [Candidatus Babeliales bacterium]|uniref:AAA family ATPase n=1 Tax=Candidatus Berkiella aquae TaxID=295108 RepID=A0A0Q9YAW4_9GAMM|nr:AAA family ATPase [Candidatus Berkiella aquae]MCS5712853.1 AAA family ATPase [Candidatus Berkiella aquae]
MSSNEQNQGGLDVQPKMSINKAAEFLGISVQAVHRKLKAKNLVCSKIGNKAFITHEIARPLFELKFKSKIVAGQIVKGGTGKTTAIDNIACCANAFGAKVLLIDIDPQGNLTDAHDVDADELPVLVDFIEQGIKVSNGIVNISPGLDLVASRIENVVLDNILMLKKMNLEKVFHNIFKSVIKDYDFIFIDCPPTMGASVTAATLFCDTILAPLNPDKFSAKGLKILKSEVKNIDDQYDKDIPYKVFLNKFSGNTILSDKAIATIIADPDMEGRALQTAVRYGQEIPNATDASKSLFSSLKKSTLRDDFEALTMELLEIKSPRSSSKTTSGKSSSKKRAMEEAV